MGFLARTFQEDKIMERNLLKDDLDEVDVSLLYLLQEDGRISNAKIAERLSLSEAPCWRRRKRLEKNGFIDNYQANLNRERLGLEVLALVHICFANHTDDAPDEFEKAIQKIPEILTCYNVTGEADYILQIVSKNLSSYELFLRTVLRKLPGVTSIRSSLALREVKNCTRLPLQTKIADNDHFTPK